MNNNPYNYENDEGFLTSSMKSPDKEPWWNDGKKVSGLAATLVLFNLAGLFTAGVIWVITKMF